MRSLFFADSDYGESVLRVIQEIIRKNPNNIKIIEEHTSLEKWLKENEPRLYNEIYNTNIVINNEDIKYICNNVNVEQHLDRIKRSIQDNDASQAISSSKDLLEVVLKTILKDFKNDDISGDIPSLLKQVQQELQIDANDKTGQKLDEKTRRLLSNFGQIVVGISEIRNIVGTGHGRIENYHTDQNHALLVVNSVRAVSFFLINLWQKRKTK